MKFKVGDVISHPGAQGQPDKWIGLIIDIKGERYYFKSLSHHGDSPWADIDHIDSVYMLDPEHLKIKTFNDQLESVLNE